MKGIIFWNVVYAIAIPSAAYGALHGSRFSIWLLICYSVLLWILVALDDLGKYLDKKLAESA